jgi:cobalt-zinc-cadmium efflux system outer membrane protein
MTKMRKHIMTLLLGAGFCMTATAWSQPLERWTLNGSIQRALQVAPEIKTADAKIGLQRGKLESADAWPNPTVSLQVDDKLGIEDGRGGYDVTQFAISQALPLGRLNRQRRQAQASLSSAESRRRYHQLLIEYEVARRFHILQLAQAKLELAQQRLQKALSYSKNGNKTGSRDKLVRYLTPLETMRLDIMQQTAKQAVAMAEGEYNEALASFRSLLNLKFTTELQLPALASVSTPADLATLESDLRNHPGLVADRRAIAAAEAGIAVARSKRFEDPTLTLFREKDYLANRRDDVTGVMLSVQIPLWNRNNGQVTQARYAVLQAQADLEVKRRQLNTSLHKSYLHLGHLIEQADHYRTHLLRPAQRVLKLTQRGFEAGSLNILSLIDANNTYFDTQQRYYELLEEGWLELAELRKSAGLSVLNGNVPAQSGEVK